MVPPGTDTFLSAGRLPTVRSEDLENVLPAALALCDGASLQQAHILFVVRSHLLHMEGPTQPRDRIQATAATYTAAGAMLNPLTHCTGLGVKPAPSQQPKPLHSDA